jgi:hypothetical protein
MIASASKSTPSLAKSCTTNARASSAHRAGVAEGDRKVHLPQPMLRQNCGSPSGTVDVSRRQPLRSRRAPSPPLPSRHIHDQSRIRARPEARTRSVPSSWRRLSAAFMDLSPGRSQPVIDSPAAPSRRGARRRPVRRPSLTADEGGRARNRTPHPGRSAGGCRGPSPTGRSVADRCGRAFNVAV